MNTSWGSKLPPRGIILLLALVIASIITSTLLIVLQNSQNSIPFWKKPDRAREKRGPLKIILWTGLFIINTLLLAVLGSYLFSLLSPILDGGPLPDADSPPPSILVPESESLPTSTLTPTPTPEPPPTSTPTPASTPTLEPTPMPQSKPLPTPAQSADRLEVSASYEYITFADANALIQARTTVAATRVIMSWSNMDGSSDTRPMHSVDNKNWTFFANFFEPGTFAIIITAYDENGQSASFVLNVPSPVS